MKNETSWGMNPKSKYPKLKGSIEADVAIIGGGLTGILVAYTLTKMGKSVVLIEKNAIGSGATYLTTAFLTGMIDTDYSDLIRSIGLKNAKLIADSHKEAIDFIKKITEQEKIEDEFVPCSNFIYSTTKKDIKGLKFEAEQLKKVGFEVDISPKTNLGFANSGYIEVKNQAKFHPLKLVNRLAEAITKNNGHIFEKTEAVKIEQDKVLTEEGEVKAGSIISATYEPFGQPLGLFFKKAVYTSYVIEVMVPKGNLVEGTFEGVDYPYHYFRVEHVGDKARVILGGEDHRADIPMNAKKKYDRLYDYARNLFGKNDLKLVRKWEGPIMESIDGLAYIGEYKNNLYATGFSGNGMTYAAIAAMMFADIIAGKKNKWQKLYDPKRLPNLRLFATKGRDFATILWNGVIRELFS